MRVRVVGTVQDGGVPHLGCSCDLCERARDDSREQRYVSSLLLSGNGERYLFDATPDIRFQVHGGDLDGVFLSHEYLGHLPGLLYLGKESLAADRLPVYCTPALATVIEENEPFAQLVDRDHVSLTEVPPGTEVDAGTGSVESVAVPHRTVHAETVGYRIVGDRTLLYISDLDEWTDRVIDLVTDADIALVDGCFWDPSELDRYDEVPHPAITRSIDLFDSEETTIRFIHLNHTNPALRPDSAERRAL